VSHAIETLAVGDLTVRIELDPEPPTPRDSDNLGRMVCLHRRYSLGDEHDYRAEDHSGWADLEAHVLRDHPGAVVLPIYMMDHSGLSISTSDAMFRAFDSAGWDWGQIGFTFASVETIREAFGGRRISRKLRAQVEDVLRAEVEEYDRYLRGDCYAFTIEDASGEILDSCGGFLGLDHAITQARAVAEELARPAFGGGAESPITHAGDRRPIDEHAGGTPT